MNNLEQTLSIIKPDAVERNLQEEIKNEFKKNNFFIIKEKKNSYFKERSWTILQSSSIKTIL